MTTPKLRIVIGTYKVQVVSQGRNALSTMVLHWTEEDPAAVWLTIEDPWASNEADSVALDWAISRAVLVTACMPGFGEKWVGVGDVSAIVRGATASIRLSSLDGECQIVMISASLAQFLTDVAKLMPLGSAEESEIYARAIDAEWPAIASAS